MKRELTICACGVAFLLVSLAGKTETLVVVSPGAVATNSAELYMEAYRTLTNGTPLPWDAMTSNTVSAADARALSERLRPVMEQIATAGEVPVCDWGVDYSLGPATLLPHLSPVRRLCQATAWEAAYRASADSTHATDLFLEGLRMARRLESDTTLISQLCAAAAERSCLEALARNLKQIAPQDLARLAAGIPDPHGDERWQNAMFGESDCLTGWLIEHVLDMTRSNRFTQATGTGDGTTTNALARDLRLCALLQVPGVPLRIGLENKDSNNFWLSEGQTRHGISLVSADFERAEATITRGAETAIIHLESGEIVPWEMPLTAAQAAEFLAMVGLDSPTSDASGGKAGRISIGTSREILRELNTLREVQDEWSRWKGWISREELEERERKALNRTGEMGKRMLCSVVNAYEAIYAAQVRERMMLAAIRLQQGDANALAATPDPTDARAFEIRANEGGGYELVSRATLRGQPVTLRIGP